MMLVPHRVEVIYPVWPWSNFILIGINVLVFVLALTGQADWLAYLILDGWNPLGLLGHAVLHLDLLHLLGNMIFLWVFGNAICSKFGNLRYLFLYFSSALFASVFHVILDGNPAVGASGAINGIIGFFVALYPVNRIHCFYWVFITAGNFSIRAGWLIGIWFLLDIFGAVTGSNPSIAFWAHIGGFIFGVCFGLLVLAKDWIEMSDHDNETLVDLIKGERIMR